MFPFPSYQGGVPLPGMQPQQQEQEDSDDDDPTVWNASRNKNVLQFHGNERTMNINPLILTNVQGSPYFKVELFAMKTFHEVVDQIYYKVDHLEPWATGSRKTAGRSQTGMCGGVRGVSAGGIVSSCYCLLYKLFTLKLTKKQVYALIEHVDSPYIRGIGFLYLRYTLPPAMMWDWFEPYLDDEEEIDIKAGGGKPMTMGEMCRLMLTRLEWFDTRFPRIAVNVEKQIRESLEQRASEQEQGWAAPSHKQGFVQNNLQPVAGRGSPGQQTGRGSREREPTDRGTSERSTPRKSRPPSASRDRKSRSKDRKSRSKDRKSRSKDRKSKEKRSRSREKRHRSRSKERSREREPTDRGTSERSTPRKSRPPSASRDRKSRSKDRKSRSRDRKSRSKDRKSKEKRSRSREKRHRSRSKERSRERKRSKSRSRDKKKKKDKDRSRSREHKHKKHKKDRSRERRRSRSRSKQRGRDEDYSAELKKFKEEANKIKKKSRRSRSRS